MTVEIVSMIIFVSEASNHNRIVFIALFPMSRIAMHSNNVMLKRRIGKMLLACIPHHIPTALVNCFSMGSVKGDREQSTNSKLCQATVDNCILIPSRIFVQLK